MDPPRRSHRPRETASFDAYRLVREGRVRLESLETAEIPEAIANFQEAVEVDPGYVSRQLATNSLYSRCDLVYGAAHALCLAALRYHGFRPSKRYIVFQVLPDTLGLGPEVWRVLSKCHDMRNRTEYEGALDVEERLVVDLIAACRQVADRIKGLPPVAAAPR